jgi:hypothetical protein
VATVRAWDSFRDLAGARHETGTMHWDMAEGDEVSPHQTVGAVSVGPPGSGLSMSIAVDHFGRITKLLVADGAEVTPRQPLLEYDERLPTTDEYWEQWEAAFAAEGKVRRLEDLMRNPFRAFWASLTRRYWRDTYRRD